MGYIFFKSSGGIFKFFRPGGYTPDLLFPTPGCNYLFEYKELFRFQPIPVILICLLWKYLGRTGSMYL